MVMVLEISMILKPEYADARPCSQESKPTISSSSLTLVIGAVAGLLVVFGVWLLDYKLHIDDPVGAVAVHCLNGIWGTFIIFCTKIGILVYFHGHGVGNIHDTEA